MSQGVGCGLPPSTLTGMGDFRLDIVSLVTLTESAMSCLSGRFPKGCASTICVESAIV